MSSPCGTSLRQRTTLRRANGLPALDHHSRAFIRSAPFLCIGTQDGTGRAKAFRRSRLLDPASLQTRSEMPSLLGMILEQTATAPSNPDEMARIDAGLEADYQKSMY